MLNLRIRRLDQDWLNDLTDDPVGENHVQKLRNLKRFLIQGDLGEREAKLITNIDSLLSRAELIEDRSTVVEVLGKEMRVVIDTAYNVCFALIRTDDCLDERYALSKLTGMFEAIPKMAEQMKHYDTTEKKLDVFVFNQLCEFRNTIAKAVGSVTDIAHGHDCFDLAYAQANLKKQIEIFDLAWDLFQEKLKTIK